MKISEMFYSLQGEGLYTGVPSVFIRFYTCSLQCQGFGQKEPSNPLTWKQPWKIIDVSNYNSIEDLPEEIYEYGCDSVYSWSAKFKNLQKDYSLSDVINKLKELNQLDNILNGDTHLIFTGGEPLMKTNQLYIIDIIKELAAINQNKKMYITFETNGTVNINKELKSVLDKEVEEVIFSISPKLLNVAGEKPEKAIKPDVVMGYQGNKNKLIFKYVFSNNEKAIQDLEDAVNSFKNISNNGVYLMPEGPNKHRVVSSRLYVAEYCMKKGYRFTDRLHTHLWDNKIGV